MSTLQLENIKHVDATSNALELHSDGTVTVSQVNGNISATGNIDANGTLHEFGNGASTYVQINNAASGDISSGYNIVSGSQTTTSLYGNADEEWTTLMSGGSIGFRVNQNVSGFNPMNIDTSGRITTPQQPFWTGGMTNTSGAGFANVWSTRSSRGGFAPSGDRLTVPVAGAWLITFNTITDTTSTRTDVFLSINGTTVLNTLNDDASGYHYRSGSIVYNLAANDYIQLNSADWYDQNSTTTDWKSMSVVFLG